MCWTCCIENLKAQIAKEDINVYKVVRKASKKYCTSLFKGYTYFKNYIHPSITLEVKIESGYSFVNIAEGYHSYSSISFVCNSLASDVDGILSKIIQCGNRKRVLSIDNSFYLATFVIPKGSVFLINENGVIVSNRIKYTGKYIKL